MRKTILTDTELSVHLQNYKDDQKEYRHEVQTIFANSDLVRSISSKNKGRIVATLLYNFDRETFLSLPLDLVDVLSGCKILDARREVKSLIKKIAQLETTALDSEPNRKKVLERKIKRLKSKKESYVDVSNKSLTRARIKIVKRWTKSLSPVQLTLKTLLLDCKLWTKLADLCHFAPRDFQDDWFLSYCFTKKAPENSLISRLLTNREETLRELYQTETIPYEYLRIGGINDEMKRAVASKEKLRTVLWYVDEIGNNELIADRLEKDPVDLPYGKLVDIILSLPDSRLKTLLIEIAERKLKEQRLSIKSPVAIFCDASSSMEVAIKTSAIISSLLCAMTQAELNVFRDTNEVVENPPRSVRDALTFATQTKADRSTSPASSMYRYLSERKHVLTIFVVTDQEENTPFNKCDFADTYYKYASLFKTFPKLIFITFGSSTHMNVKLRVKLGPERFEQVVTNYVFDLNEPDLRKLDVVLAKLA